MLRRKLLGATGALALAATTVMVGAPQPAAAQESRNLCIYDPIGANG